MIGHLLGGFASNFAQGYSNERNKPRGERGETRLVAVVLDKGSHFIALTNRLTTYESASQKEYHVEGKWVPVMDGDSLKKFTTRPSADDIGQGVLLASDIEGYEPDMSDGVAL